MESLLLENLTRKLPDKMNFHFFFWGIELWEIDILYMEEWSALENQCTGFGEGENPPLHPLDCKGG